LTFIPIFFFASEYAQIALGKTAQQAGLYLLYFFLGFAVASQIGGRILDKRGAKRPVVIGCALAAVGFGLWASKVTQLNFSNQVIYVIIAGAGMGLMLTPASTDAVNRASRLSYGEATGITQTVRNFAASLGLAILGTISVDQLRSHLTTSLIAKGLPAKAAAAEASKYSQSQSGHVGQIPHFFQMDFADATRTVFYVMAAIMALAALVAKFGLQPGLQEEFAEEPSSAPEPS
jgi:MFS family permease